MGSGRAARGSHQNFHGLGSIRAAFGTILSRTMPTSSASPTPVAALVETSWGQEDAPRSILSATRSGAGRPGPAVFGGGDSASPMSTTRSAFATACRANS